MADEQIEVHQDLLVFRVELQGNEVRADVYGGAESICGTLVYRLEDVVAAREKAGILRRWERNRTPVTYVRRGQTAALVDDLAMLTDALRG
jgi:hypothetical protein